MTLTQKQHRQTLNQSVAMVAVLIGGVVAVGWILARVFHR